MTKGVDYYRSGDLAAIIDIIERDGILRGRETMHTYAGAFPKVKAYVRRFDASRIGFSFVTDITADSGNAPGHASWTYDQRNPRPGIRLWINPKGVEHAEIDVRVTNKRC